MLAISLIASIDRKAIDFVWKLFKNKFVCGICGLIYI